MELGKQITQRLNTQDKLLQNISKLKGRRSQRN